MDTTTVKVTYETKQLLDMLQARITLISHKKKTLTELIDIITRFALKHENELLEAENLPPLKKTKTPIDREVKTDSSIADEYISTED